MSSWAGINAFRADNVFALSTRKTRQRVEEDKHDDGFKQTWWSQGLKQIRESRLRELFKCKDAMFCQFSENEEEN